MKHTSLFRKIRKSFFLVCFHIRKLDRAVIPRYDIFLGIPDRCAQLDCSTLYSRIEIFQRKGYRVHLRILQSQGEPCCKDCPLKDCLKK